MEATCLASVLELSSLVTQPVARSAPSPAPRERKHDRPVVLKVLNPNAAVTFGWQRFLDEIRAAAQLSHTCSTAASHSGGHVPKPIARQRGRPWARWDTWRRSEAFGIP